MSSDSCRVPARAVHSHREIQSMVSPSGVYSSFKGLPSPDGIYRPGFILAIAVLSSNTVDILQL